MSHLARIDDVLRAGPSISVEFFPPRTEAAMAQFAQALHELRAAHPAFISVTYGAGGSTRDLSVEMVQRVRDATDVPTLAHLTCLGHSAEEIDTMLERFWDVGVRSVLALRGDPPGGLGAPPGPEGDFHYASQLVEHIRDRHSLCIGVAGHPEGHPQARSWDDDVANLKRKVDAGAQFVITQLFFDNTDFYRWRDAARRLGVDVPMVAGIMPILNTEQIKRFTALCSARIPPALLGRLERFNGDAGAVRAVGVEHALEQCRDLLANGVSGLHLYTLNRSTSSLEIVRELR